MTDPQIIYYAPRIIDLGAQPDGSSPFTRDLALLGNILLALMLLSYFLSNRKRRMNNFVLLGVCLNISWEVYYVVIFGMRELYLIFWLAFDLLVLSQAMRFGTQQLKWPDSAKRFFPLIFTMGLLIALFMQSGYRRSFPTYAFHLSPWIVNLATNVAFNFYYLNWPEKIRNPAFSIWLRSLGTIAIAAANLIPIYSRHPAPGGPTLFLIYLIYAVVLTDITYLAMVQLGLFQKHRKEKHAQAIT